MMSTFAMIIVSIFAIVIVTDAAFLGPWLLSLEEDTPPSATQPLSKHRPNNNDCMTVLLIFIQKMNN